VIRQELHRTSCTHLPGQLPQAGCTEQLSGAKNWTSIAVLLHHAVDGRHVSVSAIVLVEEYSLVQLQFEFAADGSSLAFLCPLIIDGTPVVNSPEIPTAFKSVQIEEAPEGRLEPRQSRAILDALNAMRARFPQRQ
jgi:hypothetical protein